jgi:UDP-glucose:glycoprotein glucosyltransferase
LLPFDRTLGRGQEAVLYADITKPEFGSFHTVLSDMARKGEISYRLRYRPAGREQSAPLPVSGYGVELQLKRTDYIVIDDREASSTTDAPKPAASEVVLDAEEEVTDLKPLSSSELNSLGTRAASFIMQSEDPFKTLLKLTQDFPKYSASVAAHNESEEFLTEHYFNRAQMVPAGMNVLWMNGVQLIDRQIDPYNLVDSLRTERKLIKGVTDLGLTGKEAVSLLGHREVASAKSNDDVRRFDWRDEIEEGRVIIWLNNLEKDKRYAELPSSLMSVSRYIPS